MISSGGGFPPLSDWSALLLRLQLEGVDIGYRAKDQASKWRRNKEDFTSLFYDGHTCFTNLMAGDRVANTKMMDNMREYIQGDRKVSKDDVMEDFVNLCLGLEQGGHNSFWYSPYGGNHSILC